MILSAIKPETIAARLARRMRSGRRGVSAAARGIPFVVAAPSGTGKTTVCLALRERDPQLAALGLAHHAQPRAGESDGVDYHFVTTDEFRRLIAQGAFLEWAVYNGNHYGTSWAAIEGAARAGARPAARDRGAGRAPGARADARTRA